MNSLSMKHDLDDPEVRALRRTIDLCRLYDRIQWRKSRVLDALVWLRLHGVSFDCPEAAEFFEYGARLQNLEIRLARRLNLGPAGVPPTVDLPGPDVPWAEA